MSHKVAVMQPYFLPYLGYFHLLDAVDEFIVLDDVDFSKGGWINRNRIPVNNKPSWLTVPISKSGSQIAEKVYQIDERFFKQLVNTLRRNYQDSIDLRYFLGLVDEWQSNSISNVVAVNLFFLENLAQALPISVPRFTRHSSIAAAFNLDRVSRIVNAVRAVGGDTYVNLPGGKNLYNSKDFSNRGLSLQFISSSFLPYGPASRKFFPGMSVVDFILRQKVDRKRWVGPESYQLEE